MKFTKAGSPALLEAVVDHRGSQQERERQWAPREKALCGALILGGWSEAGRTDAIEAVVESSRLMAEDGVSVERVAAYLDQQIADLILGEGDLADMAA